MNAVVFVYFDDRDKNCRQLLELSRTHTFKMCNNGASSESVCTTVYCIKINYRYCIVV